MPAIEVMEHSWSTPSQDAAGLLRNIGSDFREAQKVRISLGDDFGHGGLLSLRTMLFGAVNGDCGHGGTAARALSVLCLLHRTGTNSENASAPAEQRKFSSVPAALAEIRRKAGISWVQLATIVGVSRRTLYLWQSGAGISSEHVSRISALYQEISELRSTLPHEIRQFLVDNYGIQAAPKRGGVRSTLGLPPIIEPSSDAIDVPSRLTRKYKRSGS